MKKIIHKLSKIRVFVVLFTISIFFLQCEKDEVIEPPTVPIAKEKPLTLVRSALPGAEVKFKNAYIETYKTAISQTYDSVLNSGKYDEKQFEITLKRAFDENPVLKSHKHSDGKQKLSKEGLSFWKKMEEGFPIKYEDFINRLGQMSLIIKHSRRISPIEKQVLYHRIAELEARSEVYKSQRKEIGYIRNTIFLKNHKRLLITPNSLRTPLKIGVENENFNYGYGDDCPCEEIARRIREDYDNLKDGHIPMLYPCGDNCRRYIMVAYGEVSIISCPPGTAFDSATSTCIMSFNIDEVVITANRDNEDSWDPFPKDTYHEGYQAGYNDGLRDGRSNCHDCSYKTNIFNQDFQYTTGYDSGYENGYAEGSSQNNNPPIYNGGGWSRGGSSSSGDSSSNNTDNDNKDTDDKKDGEYKLKEALKKNPFLLVKIDCNQIKHWQSLAQYTPPQSIIDKVEDLKNNHEALFGDWNIEYLKDAGGTVVNMDYFGVNITKLPNNPSTGLQFTAQQFLDYFRRNINDFVTGTTFEPYSEIKAIKKQETDLWNSSNPQGAVVKLDIPFNDGVVICAQYNKDYWRFMTMEAPYDSDHPVSGTRQFGIRQNDNGSYNIYVRGVDRFTSRIQEYISSLINFGDAFNNADNLWESFQEKTNIFINANGGDSSKIIPVRNRPDWNKVRDVLEGRRPISDLGCN